VKSKSRKNPNVNKIREKEYNNKDNRKTQGKKTTQVSFNMEKKA